MPESSADMEEWIPAIEAARMLAQRFGGLTRAQEAIAIGLREGLIRAGAEWASELLEGEEDPREERATAESFVEVDPVVWGKSAHWDGDRLSWNWAYGHFEIEGKDLEELYSFVDVHFPTADIEAVDPQSRPYSEVLPPAEQLGAATQRGRERKAAAKWNWEPAFADLIALADLDGLEEALGKPFKRGFQGKLESWFADWFDEHFKDKPSEAECRRRATQVVEAMERLRNSRSRT